MILTKETICVCLHCGKYPDGDELPVSDFIVHTVGVKSYMYCGYCDGKLYFQLNKDQTVTVTNKEIGG